MNIDKALEHFKWKLINKWNPTASDLEAYNSILDYKATNERNVTMQNEGYAKLYIHQLILFSRSGAYSGERSLEVLDSILNKSVYEWAMILKDEIPMMRFGSIGSNKYPLEPKDYHNFTKLKDRNKKIVAENETELTEALRYEISEDKIIKFINNQVTRTINKFEKDL